MQLHSALNQLDMIVTMRYWWKGCCFRLCWQTRTRIRDNPLLVQFEHDRQDRKAKKEAKKEAKRLAEEAEKAAAFDKLEVIAFKLP